MAKSIARYLADVASPSGVVDGTLSTAAQTNVTSLGTLSALTVDNLGINGNTITANSGALNLTPASGSAIVLDGTINVDAGVVTGATSITSTAFVGGLTGNVTGNVSGTAATVTGAAQTNITSLGTLTALTVDNITLNGSTISSGNNGNINFPTASSGNADISFDGSNFTIVSNSSSANLKLQTNSQDALTIAANGTATFASALVTGSTITAGSTIHRGNMTIDSQEIDVGSGNLTFDIAGDIILDADGGDIFLKDGGTDFGLLANSSNNLLIRSAINDADIVFQGYTNGGSTTVTALTLDMSGSGAATFNNTIAATGATFTNSSSGATATGNTVLTVEGNDNTELSILGGSSSVLALNFGHSGDNNEGLLYFNTTAGSENMQLDSSKDITFRNTAGNGPAGKTYFKAYNTAIMTIDGSNNRVGIGIGSPTQKLDVRGGSGSGTLTHAIFTGTSARGLELRTRSDTSGGQNSGTAEINSADSEGTGGDLAFSSNGNVRMFIDGGGTVGIGTTNPLGDLHIQTGSTNAFTASNDSWHTIVLHNNASAATNTTGIAFEVSGSGYHGNAGTGIAAVKNGTNSDYGADLAFITRPQAAVAAERMRITDTGDVGVGTTNPIVGSGWNRVLHLHSPGAGSHIRFTDSITGASGEDGTFIGHYSDTTYVINRESGDIDLMTDGRQMLRLSPNVFSFGGGSTSHGRIRQYHYAVAMNAGTTVALLQNTGAHTDIQFLYWIEAYHSGRTYRVGIGNFGGYGLSTQSATYGGLDISVTAVSTGIKRLDFAASSSFATTAYIGMLIFGDGGLTVHNGTIGDAL